MSLRILVVTPMPSSPPRFGAQARMHGLLSALGRRHALHVLVLADEGFDRDEVRRATAPWATEVVVVPNPHPSRGPGKRLLQLRSAFSRRSFDRLRAEAPGLPAALAGLLARGPFDLVHLEFPTLAHLDLAGPDGRTAPLVLDTHEVAHDLVRQFARSGQGRLRRLHARVEWPKLRREELAAFRRADGIAACSAADAARIRAEVPDARIAVVPNAADTEHYAPRADDGPPEALSVVFFGLLSTAPNVDGVTWLVRDVWPRVVRQHPGARLRILGKDAGPEVLALASPTVEVVGFVDDLRPHLARAAVVAVPLRLGGGTRLKIVEAMAMGRPVVSTALGAEGLDVEPGRELLIADGAEDFAAALSRVVADRPLAEALGAAARVRAVERYAWTAAADVLEGLWREVVDRRA